MTLRRTGILSMALLAVGLLATEPASAQKARDTLRIALGGSLEVIDPYYTGDREVTMVIGEMVFDTLIYRDPVSFEHKPLLATAWRWNDEVTLDLDLRQDVKWQDGQPFTADDVVYTFSYLLNPANKVWRPEWARWMKQVEAQGPHKVRIHLNTAFQPAVEYLSQVLPIMPKDFFGAGGVAGGNGRLVGTGPYKITGFQPGKGATLEKNPTYFTGGPKGTPSIGTVVVRNIPDQVTQIAELASGGIDWVWRLPSDQMERLGKAPGVEVSSGGTMRTFWFGFDAAKGPFQDAKVRRAVAHAIDRETLVKELIGASSPVLNVPCYPTQFGCIDAKDVPRFEYDVAKAKQLMAEAGKTAGFDTSIVIYAQGPNRMLAEAIQGYLRAINIKAGLSITSIKGFFEAVQEGKAPLKLESFGQYNINDVGVFLPEWFGGGNRDSVRDPALIQAFKEAAATGDAARRKALFQQASKTIVEKNYWVPLFIQAINYGHSKDVAFKAYDDENPRFYMTRWK